MKPDVVYLVTSEPDGWNRRTFWGFWPDWVGRKGDECGVRGQIFHAVLGDYMAQESLDRKPKRKLVIYLKDLRTKRPDLTEIEAMRHCEDLVRK